MPNREGHRRFGNVRRRESGRYQIRYPGPDGRMRTGPETYERKSDADRALVMVEAQIRSGDWTDPERGKVKLGDYGSAWITERPGLRPRTMDLYRWLLRKHIEPYLGGVPVGRRGPDLLLLLRPVQAGVRQGSRAVRAGRRRIDACVPPDAYARHRVIPSAHHSPAMPARPVRSRRSWFLTASATGSRSTRPRREENTRACRKTDSRSPGVLRVCRRRPPRLGEQRRG